MKDIIRRIICAILLVAVIAFGCVYKSKAGSAHSWEQVLTARFWILSIIHIIPAYFVIWSFEDKGLSWTESRIIRIVIAFGWFILFFILNFFIRLLFGIDLLVP